MSKQSRQAKAVAEKYGIDTRLTWDKIKKNFYQYRGIYLMLIPVLAFYIVFNYAPLQACRSHSATIALVEAIWGSAWVGLANFKQFFTGPYFGVFCAIPCTSAFILSLSASQPLFCLH